VSIDIFVLNGEPMMRVFPAKFLLNSILINAINRRGDIMVVNMKTDLSLCNAS
jgi:hypothetical protein